MSVKIEGVPDGYELVRIGQPQEDEMYIATTGEVMVSPGGIVPKTGWAIVRKIEPPYSERQAAWVKEHDVKVGDTAKVLRMFGEQENGFTHYANPHMKQFVGVKYKVTGITEKAIILDSWAWPYCVLEKCEPVTRPMTRDEFLAAWKQRGFCPLIDTEGVVRAVITVEASDGNKLFVETYDEWHEFDELKSWKFASDESPISVTEN